MALAAAMSCQHCRNCSSYSEAKLLPLPAPLQQFISAVKYCHSHHVAHRDLKLDNTLLDNSNPPIVKLCDFGFAKQWGGEDANMLTLTG